MKELAASELKTIIHSKRANLYYLEHCRVLVSGGRVEYLTENDKQSLYWNIPIANTTAVLLRTGTSITQAAVRELAKAGVLLGFCGGGGTPLFAGLEQTLEVAWLQPQSEYRPTEYLQHWVRFWFDEPLRLAAAKAFQQARLARLRNHWATSRALKERMLTVPLGGQTSTAATLLELAVAQHESDQVSLGRAAEVAGLPYSRMVDELGRRSIPVVRYSVEDLDRELEHVRTLAGSR